MNELSSSSLFVSLTEYQISRKSTVISPSFHWFSYKSLFLFLGQDERVMMREARKEGRRRATPLSFSSSSSSFAHGWWWKGRRCRYKRERSPALKMQPQPTNERHQERKEKSEPRSIQNETGEIENDKFFFLYAETKALILYFPSFMLYIFF